MDMYVSITLPLEPELTATFCLRIAVRNANIFAAEFRAEAAVAGFAATARIALFVFRARAATAAGTGKYIAY